MAFIVLLLFILQDLPLRTVTGSYGFYVLLAVIFIFNNIYATNTNVQAAQFRDGDARLVGGSYQWEGRVETFFAGSWGTITDSDWTSEDAQAVCRMLGYFRPGI